MRVIILFVFAVLLLGSPSLAQTQTVKTGAIVSQDNRLPGHEPDTYRFGIAYLSTRGTTPGQCEAACNRDTDRCAAWSLVPASFQMGPRCELKRNIGAQEYRPGAVSGIALRFQPRGPQLQEAFDRRTVVPAPREVYRPAPMSAPRPLAPTVTPRPQTLVRPAPTMQPSPRPVMTSPAPGGQELLGGPQPVQPTAAAHPAPVQRPAPVQGPATAPQQERPPQFQMRPAPTTPTPAAATPQPQPRSNPAPTRQAQPQPRSTQAPAPQAQPQPRPAATAPSTSSGGVQIDPPPPQIQPRNRVPWHQRTADTPDYSVSEMDLIPGDAEATAGFIGGVPEE